MKTPTKQSEFWTLRTIIMLIIIGIGIPLFIRNCAVQAFHIPTGSMKPTLLLGDRFLVDKFWAKRNKPTRGDLVVFKYPRNLSIEYVKRCIALPNDTIEIHNDVVWVNGVKEELKYVKQEYDSEERREVVVYEASWKKQSKYFILHFAEHNLNVDNWGPIVVPPDHYFMMGDNRDNTSDSRHFGFIPQENILGKARFIYMSWDRDNQQIRWSRIGKVLQ